MRLLKWMNKNQFVDIIYMSNDGKITKRRVKLYKVDEQYFRGYCFLRQSTRTFSFNNVLALVPVMKKRRMVI